MPWSFVLCLNTFFTIYNSTLRSIIIECFVAFFNNKTWELYLLLSQSVWMSVLSLLSVSLWVCEYLWSWFSLFTIPMHQSTTAPHSPHVAVDITSWITVEDQQCLLLHSFQKQTFLSPFPKVKHVNIQQKKTSLWNRAFFTVHPVSIFSFFSVSSNDSSLLSAYSSYRLDKMNSDVLNYITNFAADLRWIHTVQHPPPHTHTARHVAVVRIESQLAESQCWRAQYGRLVHQTLTPDNERSRVHHRIPIPSVSHEPRQS